MGESSTESLEGSDRTGEGEDGRIKSAAGIGTLLEDGIGDTIRVSLTEDPEFEIPVAKALVNRYNNRSSHDTIPEIKNYASISYSPYEYKRRATNAVVNLGGNHVPCVIADYSSKKNITAASLFPVGYNYAVALDKWNLSDQACDYIYCGDNIIDFEIPGTLGLIYNNQVWNTLKNKTRSYPLFCGNEYFTAADRSDQLNFIAVDASVIFDSENNFLDKLNNDPTVALIVDTINVHGMAEQRRIFIELMEKGVKNPVIIKRNYQDIPETH